MEATPDCSSQVLGFQESERYIGKRDLVSPPRLRDGPRLDEGEASDWLFFDSYIVIFFILDSQLDQM